MQKLIAVFFVSFVAFNLSACGKSEEDKKEEARQAASEQFLGGDLSQPSPERKW